MVETGPEAPQPSEGALDHRVVVRTGQARYRSDVAVRGHELVADEPAERGGGDFGPTPFDLLCAALASCTTITLRMYADRKGWPLEEIVARVEHRSGGGGGNVEGGQTRDQMVVTLALEGDLEAGQRDRLAEIAARCPVHRTLLAGLDIETGIEEPE
ncbi:MAG: OsmC family protein [Gemmatimonadota bacterium]